MQVEAGNMSLEESWITVCEVSDLIQDCGICVLIDERGHQQQVAIFQLGEAQVYALDNIDPIGHAAVLSRGITGSLGEHRVVASPLYKHHYCLETGQCLEDEQVTLRTWPVRILDGRVQLQVS